MNEIAALPKNSVSPPLIGRDDILAVAARLFRHSDTRLITISGPAGVGKTRFALELLRVHGERAGKASLLVELASLKNAGDLDAEVARAAGITVGAGESLAGAVDAWLASRSLLLLLDNAEHLMDISPRIVEWLGTTPHLQVVVTSRQRLNLSMEKELELQPLRTNPSPAGGPLSPAAELFARMAGCSDPDRLPATTRDAVEHLATRLDGLPLALELVAARVSHLDTERIAELLETTDAIARSLPAVASALDVAVARSYDLLSPRASDLLRYLTVSTGGFTADLAERLVEHAPALTASRDHVADLLDELSAHHLVLVQHNAREDPRFTILAMVSETVGRIREKRGETGAACEALALAVLDFAAAREYAGFWPGHEHEITELSANYHNLLAAIGWLHEQGKVQELVRLVGSLTWLWYNHGHYAHGLHQFEHVLKLRPEQHGRDWARFELGRGVLLDLMGRFEEARVAMQAGLAGYNAAYSIDGVAAACIALGFNACHRGRYDAAQEMLDRAIRVARTIPERPLGMALEALALANIGANAQERGDLAAAEVSLRRALEIHENMRFQWGTARGQVDLGGVLRDIGRPAEALDIYRRAVANARALEDHRLIAVALAGIATVLIHDGQSRVGAWLYGGVSALHPIAGQPSYLRANEVAWQRGRDTAQAAIGSDEFERAWLAGNCAPLDSLIAVASRTILIGVYPYPPSRHPLTRQERSVLKMVLQDLTTTMIGELLGISERTVNSHLHAIYRKYGVNSRLELLALAAHHRGEPAED